MARSSECTESYAQKMIDTADIVRDAIFQQLQLERLCEEVRNAYSVDPPASFYW
jgi:hypothetical protein